MRTKLIRKVLSCIVCCAFAFAMIPGGGLAGASLSSPSPAQAPPPQDPQQAQLTPEQLQDLVAPIALYPDALVAQILAASAYPTQIVEAERFLEDKPKLKGKDLAKDVDKQDWDPSVKALTAFPSVLANLNKDLSWTSTLGDVNINQPADVMNAIQFLRKKAQDAGNLKTTPQQNVTNESGSVVIQPANPEVVYVPDYDPWLVYGYPLAPWPEFYPWWDVTGPYIGFGVGFGIAPFFGFGWGWRGWGFDWGHRGLLYGGGPYAFHSRAFYDRNAYFRGNYRGYAAPYARGDRAMRGFSAPAGRSGSFGGIRNGGDVRGFSSRGQFSMGARGGFGGGFGGGGFHGGGGRR